MRRTTRISLAAATALGTTGLAVALAFGAATPGSAPGVLPEVAAGTVLVDSTLAEAQLSSESESLSAIAAERAVASADAAASADMLDAMKAQRTATAERATRDAERIALEKAAAERKAAEEAAAKKAAEEAAAAEAERIASSDPRSVGQALAAQRGWTGEQWSCLNSLWTRESNWTVTADNPTSSAYGIPQALPGSKMSSHGSDWATNPATQIAWGLDYIGDRYGSPCGAWGHSESNNWY